MFLTKADLEHRDYANSVSFYSQLVLPRSLYTGSHFDKLSAYLQQPFEARAPDLVPKTPQDSNDTGFNFVTLYDLEPLSNQCMEHLNLPADDDYRSTPDYGKGPFGPDCPRCPAPGEPVQI